MRAYFRQANNVSDVLTTSRQAPLGQGLSALEMPELHDLPCGLSSRGKPQHIADQAISNCGLGYD
jgi:hypothetical protein